eukprot:CAMPEP_0182925926 /NCGR_PEP_ID=MMETSP0105_2-20130417/10736_1 /TAXON_ID=81532 ORGANISM="Acanthoeca-like sp., Strain 10tr" /NCGR_SAMPLE_ID=MMETSP0105_2 /ASSEMBLY_ACC=CAM_ASM_000205 /LENGTH=122 /DNA_ID=CAMNT_0025063797 /DNA_START=48 /DNA_END=413 /DNA_ORIENTATION=-
MSDDYAAMKGGLKLKGLKISKKKAKKEKKRREKAMEAALEAAGVAAAAAKDKDKKKEMGTALTAEYEDTRTEAQKKFDEVQKQREIEKIQKAASKTHKEKVDEMNEYLSKLSEHYDIPKVSW